MSKAREIAQERLARGEIAPAEYEEILRNLGRPRPAIGVSSAPGRRSGGGLAVFVVVAVVLLASLGLLAAYHLGPLSPRSAAIGTMDQGTFLAKNAPPPGVEVLPAQNEIVVNASGATLLVEASPVWYPESGNFFLAYGLVDPTFVVPPGGVVSFVVINMDNEAHNLAVTSLAPPYDYMPMMGGGMMGSGNGSAWLGIAPMLPGIVAYHGNQTLYDETGVTVTFAQSGVFRYLCLYPGHAEMGMYGNIIVGQ